MVTCSVQARCHSDDAGPWMGALHRAVSCREWNWGFLWAVPDAPVSSAPCGGNWEGRRPGWGARRQRERCEKGCLEVADPSPFWLELKRAVFEILQSCGSSRWVPGSVGSHPAVPMESRLWGESGMFLSAPSCKTPNAGRWSVGGGEGRGRRCFG